MSQSPSEKSDSSSIVRYRQGWKALNRLLHEDRSFSGNEKNCAFLNMRNGQFAGISSVSGLDFNDDSRALALCDWDFDGRQDLWTTARTAPRVRFLKNETPNVGHFVAVQLRGNGTTTSRDAVGARVEVVTEGNEKSIRTLHAGEGFLTQSSRWLHFGLGDQTAISVIRVHWPGGEEMSYTGLEADHFYMISQDSGEVALWEPPENRNLLPAQPQAVLPPELTARIIPASRLPLPYVERAENVPDSRPDGRSMGGRLEFQGTTLVSVWSSTCNNCLHELAEWSKRATEFNAHGLRIVAVNADPNTNPVDLQARTDLLQRLGFAFENIDASPSTIRKLDLFQRSILDRWQPMPVPCSFLVDGLGQVIAIYRGPVNRSQVFEDLSLVDAPPEQARLAGLPFPGRWATSLPAANPLRVSSQLVDHAQIDSAIEYLQQFVDVAVKSGSVVSDVTRSDVQYTRAVLLDSQGRSEEALQALESCRKLNPRDFRVRSDLAKRYLRRNDLPAAESELVAAVEIRPADTPLRRDLGVVLLSQGKLERAIEAFRMTLQQQPDDALSLFHMATALRKSGDWQAAVRSYESALRARPNFVLAANNLAWIWSTHPDETIRRGSLAVRLSQRICQQTKMKDPKLLDTLAASYAEVGAWDEAAAAIDRAIRLVEEGGDNSVPLEVTSLRSRKLLYANRKPYRDHQ